MRTITSGINTSSLALIAPLPTIHLITCSRNPPSQVPVAYLPLDYHNLCCVCVCVCSSSKPTSSQHARLFPTIRTDVAPGFCPPVFFTHTCQEDEWLGQLMTDNSKPSLLSFSRLTLFLLPFRGKLQWSRLQRRSGPDVARRHRRRLTLYHCRSAAALWALIAVLGV